MSGYTLQNFYPIYGPIPGWTVVGAADLNHDGIVDVVLQYTNGAVGLWYMAGTNGQTAGSFHWIDQAGNLNRWRVAGFADVNHDGNPDMVVQNTTTWEVDAWLLGPGGGDIGHSSIQVLVPAYAMSNWKVVAVADVNGDGNPDLVLENALLPQDEFVYLNAQGVPASQPVVFIPNNTTGWGIIGAQDINGDGVPDFVIKYTDNSLAVWYWNTATINRLCPYFWSIERLFVPHPIARRALYFEITGPPKSEFVLHGYILYRQLYNLCSTHPDVGV